MSKEESALITGSEEIEKFDGNAIAMVKPIAINKTDPEIQRLLGVLNFVILPLTLPDVTPVTHHWVSDELHLTQVSLFGSETIG
jgi:hypothetical protein